MPRIYKTKGDDALREKITVPVTQAVLSRLKEFSKALKVSPTSLARLFIEEGMHRAAKPPKPEK